MQSHTLWASLGVRPLWPQLHPSFLAPSPRRPVDPKRHTSLLDASIPRTRDRHPSACSK